MALTTFTNGTVADADEVNANFTLVNGLMPVGGVMAWLKSYTNTPALDSQFVECNGQTLSDAESVYDGQTIPDLNGTTETDKLFLRGATTSGGTGGTATHDHFASSTPSLNGSAGFGSYGAAVNHTPPYYEVVWVMRIK